VRNEWMRERERGKRWAREIQTPESPSRGTPKRRFVEKGSQLKIATVEERREEAL